MKMIHNTTIALLSSLLMALLLASCGGGSLQPQKIQVAQVSSEGMYSVALPEQAVWQAPSSLPEGWQQASEVTPNAEATDFTEVAAGTGIWMASASAAPLSSDWQHQGLELSLDFLCLQGAGFSVKLTPGYSLQLSHRGNSSGVLTANGQAMQPLLSAAAGAGIWQRLYLNYLPPIVAEDGTVLRKALLQNVSLNGATIHSEVKLPLDDGAAAPASLSLVPEGGKVAFKNLRYKVSEEDLLAEAQRLSINPTPSLPNMQYAYYELGPGPKVLPDLNALSPVETGTIEMFDIEKVSKRPNDYAIKFTGMLNFSATSKITFYLVSDDGSFFFLDGKKLIDNDGGHAMIEKEATVKLTAGQHEIEVWYFQGGGGSGLQLFYQVEGYEKTPFNTYIAPKATEATGGAFQLQPDERPYLQRGFVAWPRYEPDNQANRQTHAISVGDASGWHYSFDMESGSLLQVWYGGFVDVKEMWQSRGIQQTAIPLGSPLNVATRTNWALLESPSDIWPDTVQNVDQFTFKSYELNEKGHPVFNYQWGEAQISDGLLPHESGGLVREITVNNPEGNLWLVLAKGSSIRFSEGGSYVVESPGFMLNIMTSEGWEYAIQEGENGQMLMAHPVGFGDARLQYRLRW